MQPNPPQPMFPQHGQPPMSGGPAPLVASPRPRADGTTAVTASILALLTAAMLVWFAFHDIFYLYETGGLSSMLLMNVLGGAVGAGLLLVAAGFTFVRRISGAWTLCALCALYAVATIVMAPLLWGVPLGDQLKWIFGFDKSNGVAIGLSIIFGVLTAVMAAIAASVKSHEPATAAPPRP